MLTVRTVNDLHKALSNRGDGSVGLVPTMGALHAGHLSLVERARSENDTVVVSVFVNPTQFNNAEDLATYPRTEAADAALLEQAGVDICFMPTVEEVYPEPDTRVFDLGPVAEVMEGPMRPGHFNGVAQVVSKLFAMTKPTRAYFGEKDYQQIAVIRRMRELIDDKPEIVACPIKRTEDGLALSSRNVRLNAEERRLAPGIHRALEAAREWSKSMSPAEVAEKVTETIDAIEGFETEYFAVADAATLQPVEDWSRPAVGCVAVWVNRKVRLIDIVKF